MFTDFWGGTKKPVQWNPIYKLLSKRYELELTNSPDFLFYSGFGKEYLKFHCVRIFITGENVRPNYNECDYAFSFDYPFDERNYRLPLYRLYNGYDDLFRPRDPEKVIAENRKFCGFLVSNDVPGERIRLLDLLNGYKKVDSGGKFRNNIGNPVPRGQEISWFLNYKFSIAFENSSHPGYTTEKLLHSLVAESIPIYWGNPLVNQEFNTKAFVNTHEYNSLEDVLQVVKEIDRNQILYREYLSQPFFPQGVEIETNKEEKILERFDLIIKQRKNFVTIKDKKLQKLKYPYVMSIRLVNKKLKPLIKRILRGNQ